MHFSYNHQVKPFCTEMFMERATESKAVIAAIAELANKMMSGNRIGGDTVMDAIDMLQVSMAVNKDIPVADKHEAVSGLKNMRNGLLRAMAIKSRDRDMQESVHVSHGLEAVTGTDFLETTRKVTALLVRHGTEKSVPDAPSAAELGFMVGGLENLYKDTVGKVLKDEQGIDVAANLSAKIAAGDRTGAGGMQRGGGRITDARTQPSSKWADPK